MMNSETLTTASSPGSWVTQGEEPLPRLHSFNRRTENIGASLSLYSTLSSVRGRVQQIFALAEAEKPVVVLWFPVGLWMTSGLLD